MTATTDLGTLPETDPLTTDEPALDQAVFRSVFRRHAAGVAVITAAAGGRPVGFTATSLTSVSVEPPLLSFGISHRLLELADRRREPVRRRARARRAPGAAGRDLRPQRRRPLRPGDRLGARAVRRTAAARRPGLAGVPRRWPGYPPATTAIVIARADRRRPRRARGPAALPPGWFQRPAGLKGAASGRSQCESLAHGVGSSVY